MLRSFLPLCLTFAVGLISVACEKKKTVAQQNADKQRAWQAEQKVKAAKYYQTLVEKYPDSQYANQAKERLQAIGPVKTPAAGAKKP